MIFFPKFSSSSILKKISNSFKIIDRWNFFSIPFCLRYFLPQTAIIFPSIPSSKLHTLHQHNHGRISWAVFSSEIFQESPLLKSPKIDFFFKSVNKPQAKTNEITEEEKRTDKILPILVRCFKFVVLGQIYFLEFLSCNKKRSKEYWQLTSLKNHLNKFC